MACVRSFSGVGITMPCAAFVVSTVQEALGGRGGPTPKGGTSRTAAGNGEMEEKMFCTKREDNKLCDKKAGQQVKLI